MPNVDVTRIAGNIGAMNALNSLMYVNNQLAVHQTRLASGKRLNEAADDPSGYNLAMTFDIRRNDLKVALTAIGDAKNLLAIAETGLRKIADIMVKMKSKVMESAGATIGNKEREAIATQLNAFSQEINDIVESTNWNGVDLIGAESSGSTGTKKFFVGVDASGSAVFADFKYNITGAGSAGFDTVGLLLKGGSASGTLDVSQIGSSGCTATGLEYYTVGDISFSSSASGVVASGSTTLNTLTDAIASVKSAIIQVGAMSARLTFKEEAMNSTYINTEAAYNRIMNANMAEEQVNASKYMILQQTATAMLAQANMAPQFLLQLFQ